ncbi:MAG: transcriptional regulator, ArsR family [uncultured archaeon A07HB70]|nr:MAG: transcriptional regulator, ArsR family [uncultured archaeon A07HB70]
MDSAVLLDLLGNENRRRILRLLARKPCYVTEISEYLGVSPKAVIDHLRKLEEAGLVESRTDDQRRKYFNISRNLRLEVNVSPYGFGTKSAYPASQSLDMSRRCPHLSIDVPSGESDGVTEVAEKLKRLEELENELSLAQRWVYGRITEVLDELNDRIGPDVDGRFHAEVLAAVATGASSVEAVGDEVEAPVEVVEEALRTLAERGLVVRDGDGWRVR